MTQRVCAAAGCTSEILSKRERFALSACGSGCMCGGTNLSILFIDASNKADVVLIDASVLGTKVKDGKNQKPAAPPARSGFAGKAGGGSRTHYTLIHLEAAANRHPEQGELPLEGGKYLAEGGNRHLPPLPQELAARLPKAGQRISGLALQALICDLCAWHALRGEELATLLSKDLKYLRNKHLSVLIQSGKLVFLYPESPTHALQAYKRV